MRVKVKQFGGVNHFLIKTDDGVYLQSYDSIVVYNPWDGKIQLGTDWDYSRTTMKYLSKFLGEGKKSIEKKLKEGTYVLNEEL